MPSQPVTLAEFARLWLAVKLAMGADGRMIPAAFHAVKAHFGDTGGDPVVFRRLMALAERQHGDAAKIARLALRGMGGEEAEALFFRLVHVARATDSGIGVRQLRQLHGFLRATRMGMLSRWRLLLEIRREHNPHALLGAAPRLSRSYTRKLYHRIAQEYHPDGARHYGYGASDMAQLQHCLMDAMQGYRQLCRPALPSAA